MASISQYKATGRTARSGMLEISPTAGMKFTNNPITEGYCKTMVNMDVDTALSVLRPRPAYEDDILKSLVDTKAIKDFSVADVLFSGKVYVDVWDTSDVHSAIESSDAVRELDDNTVQEIYGDTSITSELRDIVVVGYGKRVIDKRTYYDNVEVIGIKINETTGEPVAWDYYTDSFKGMDEASYNEIALTKNKSYVTATTYMKLKGLEYHYNNTNVVPKFPLKHDVYQDYIARVQQLHGKEGIYAVPMRYTYKFMAETLCKSPGISCLPNYEDIDYPSTARTNTVISLQNTLYFIGRTRSDSYEYNYFRESVASKICELGGYIPDSDAETVSELIDCILDDCPQLQSRVSLLTNQSLKAIHLVERITAAGHKEHFVCGCSVTPQEPAASEVINYGYNMLLQHPYDLQSDHDYTATTILLDGILVKDPITSKIRLHARVGENLRFELLYKTNKDYIDSVGGVRVRWEITDVTSSGNTTVLRDIWDSAVYDENSDIYFEFQPSYKTFSILCKVYREKDVQEVLADESLATLEDKYNDLSPVRSITLASYTLTDRVANRQAELKEFDLTTAKGIVTWLERFVLWGVEGAEANIFVSEAGTTNYFPYPNGYDEFPAKVIKCLPYGQQLLVLTENELYLCTMNADGLTFTKQCIQTGLNIDSRERDNIVTVANMVSFFSDDKIYLIVPKSGSLTGALQLAPISNQINYFLKDLDNNIWEIVQRMYGLTNERIFNIVKERFGITDALNVSPPELTQCNKYVYVEGSKIWYTYAYDITVMIDEDEQHSSLYSVMPNNALIVSLVYDTNTRVWSIVFRQGSKYKYTTFEGGSSVDRQTLLTFKILRHVSDDSYNLNLFTVRKNKTTVQDYIIGDDNMNSIDNPDSKLFLFKNYQFLDTGYRLTDVSRKKRFREVQFNLNNIDGYEIPMGCAIFVDDNERKMLYNYSVNIVRTAENSAEAVVTQSLDTRGLVRNTTLRARDEDIVHYNKEYATGEQNMFLLDTTKFEQVSNYKVRIKTSGKGYSPRAQLLFKPKGYYELFYINWVYRSMSQR